MFLVFTCTLHFVHKINQIKHEDIRLFELQLYICLMLMCLLIRCFNRDSTSPIGSM